MTQDITEAHGKAILYEWVVSKQQTILIECGAELSNFQGGLMLRIFGKTSRGRLSHHAKEILEAASGRGEVFLLRSSGSGKWVASGSHHFHDPRNPSVTDAYLQGFRELQAKGLLVHDSGNHYRLNVGNPELGKWLK